MFIMNIPMNLSFTLNIEISLNKLSFECNKKLDIQFLNNIITFREVCFVLGLESKAANLETIGNITITLMVTVS